MNLEVPKTEIKSATRVTGGPSTPRKGPPKFKQRQTRQFKSKPPKKGIQGFGDDIPGNGGLRNRYHRHLSLGGLQSPGAQ
ncbi:hypothetical protein CesoFtcFv8_022467 [Champsocephalus esox]|uniref:Retinal rod rhodopsin-sensitive cGMP 3',5'-cyclic phosphodiesterase subunit gamma n=1 Tax=Champsocephalus esox TaxID=159716 RepID=A0AAN8BBJ4_9TELE|nr:hypothetical protein CesoFtcFv8_022467 [Champsocephalus esox]